MRTLSLLLVLASGIVAQTSNQAAGAQAGKVAVDDDEIIRLRGMVTLNGTPVDDAAVSIQPMGGSLPTLPVAYLMSSRTDAQGNFVLDGLEPGNYMLMATKTGMITAYYGARQPGGQGTILTLAAGARLNNLQIAIPPPAIIRGQIVDIFGDPLASSQVKAMRVGYLDGRRELQTVQQTSSDDEGNYQFSLPQGRYYLGARPPIPGASGDGADVNGPHEDEVPTYYPNSVDARGAAPLNITAGAELAGINIEMQSEEVYLFHAHMVNAETGEPVTGAALAVTRLDPDSANELHPMVAQVREEATSTTTTCAPGRIRRN